MSSTRFFVRRAAAVSFGAFGSLMTVAALSVTATGCGDKSNAASGASTAATSMDDARTQAQSDYTQSLQDTDDAFAACVAAGACTTDAIPVATNDAGLALSTMDEFGNVRPQGLLSSVTSLVKSAPSKLCSVLTAIEPVEHLWFYIGASGMVGAILTGVTGIDMVYNLWDRQAAIFVYGGVNVMVFGGASASLYEGFGADSGHSDVIQGWSGAFVGASVSVAANFAGLKFLGVSASGFCSAPSPTLCGVGVSLDASIAFDLKNPLPLGITGGSVAFWKPWDSANAKLSTTGYFVKTVSGTMSTDSDGTTHPYAQYTSATSMALSMLSHGGAATLFGATAGLGLAALQKNGLTIEQMCPSDGGTGAATNPSLVTTN